MGKDFRIGLLLGLMLALGVLIWVATRPSLTPEARMRRAMQAHPRDFELPLEEPALPELPADAPAEETQRVADAPPQEALPKADGSVPAAAAAANPQSENRNPQSDGLPDWTIYERAEPIETTRFHIVRRGESLSVIARQYYNSPNAWRKILAANPDVKDANRIAPGTKLIIP